jgi:hypothetical protein
MHAKSAQHEKTDDGGVLAAGGPREQNEGVVSLFQPLVDGSLHRPVGRKI